MDISRPATAVLAAVCVTAGAAGAYFVSRTGAPPSAVESPGPSISLDPAAVAVDQSEAVVQDTSGEGPVLSSAAPVAPKPPAIAPARRPVAASNSARQRRTVPAAEPVGATRASPTSPAPPEPRESLPPPEPLSAVDVEPVRTIEPPAPQFEELIVSADSVIGLNLERPLSSELARVEDEVLASVTRDVRIGDRVAIPAGSRAYGEVTLVERGGKVRDRARLGIRFTSIVLADGTRVPLETDTIYRDGDSPGGESAAKIGGGAIGGAIIGGIFGGAKGAILGGSAGAGAGTAAVLAGGRNPATFPAGAPVTVRLQKPATVTVEK